MSAPDLPPPPTPDKPLAVYAHVAPGLVQAHDFEGCTAIVIDVLRATSTMLACLHAGAAAVRPMLTVNEVNAAFAAAPPGSAVRAGERGGLRIPGFELDNSPASATPDLVRGRTVLLTSTNGTSALLHARAATRVLIAGFVNVSAVCRAVVRDPRPIRILCAGTRDQPSLEDCLVAGAIVDQLSAARPLSEDDGARLCLEAWRCTLAQPGGLMRSMRSSRGARNLERLGFEADVEWCAQMDAMPLVAEYDSNAVHESCSG